jgi:hypothetical protein
MLMSDKNPYKKGGMFESASFLLFEKAKQLRNKMTGAEEALWIHLKKGNKRKQVSKTTSYWKLYSRFLLL